MNKNGSIFITGIEAEREPWSKVIPSNQYNENGNNLKSTSVFLYKLSEDGELIYFRLLTLGKISEGNKVKVYN